MTKITTNKKLCVEKKCSLTLAVHFVYGEYFQILILGNDAEILLNFYNQTECLFLISG